MILNAFKEKSKKKIITSLLYQQRQPISIGRIKTIGVVVNSNEFTDYEALKSLKKEFNAEEVQCLVFFSNKKESALAIEKLKFTAKDISFKGKPKTTELTNFLNTNFDILINYYTQPNTSLLLISAKAKARFKIGILPTENEVNDLTVFVNPLDYEVFKTEMNKYLTILKNN